MDLTPTLWSIVARQFWWPHELRPGKDELAEWHWEVSLAERTAIVVGREGGSIITAQRRLPGGEVQLLARLARPAVVKGRKRV